MIPLSAYFLNQCVWIKPVFCIAIRNGTNITIISLLLL
nr:MAG TPA: hypothetical protein [Caudoviricetes sp.]